MSANSSFIGRLKTLWSKRNSLVCVGLDPELKKIPEHIRKMPNPIFEFNRQIIDATADLVCVYKPQFAYYAAVGAEEQLAMTFEYIRKNYPDVPVILDSKRGDIGSTAEMYATEAFDRYKADAVTVNPYLGLDSITPFLNRKEKGVILLCRTSNPGAKDIQDLMVDGKKLYHRVAELAANDWNTNGNILLVVGATYPKEAGEIRAAVGDVPFLVPGIGAQGGDVHAVVRNGMDSQGAGLLISSSRAIIYADSGKDFAKAARKATETLKEEINRARD